MQSLKAQAASAKLKLTEAKPKAKIMLVKKQVLLTGSALWRKALSRVGKDEVVL